MKFFYLFLFFFIIAVLITSAWLFLQLAEKGMISFSLVGLGAGFFLCVFALGYLVGHYINHPSSGSQV